MPMAERPVDPNLLDELLWHSPIVSAAVDSDDPSLVVEVLDGCLLEKVDCRVFEHVTVQIAADDLILEIEVSTLDAAASESEASKAEASKSRGVQ